MKRAFSLLLFPVFLQSMVSADVLVVRQTQFDGFGGMGSSTKQTKTWISGAKQREQDITDKKSSSFLGKMAADERAKITRVDKKLIWMVNEPRKNYQEISLVPKESKSADEKSAASSDQEESSGAQEKPTMRISKAEFKVQAGGHSKTISEYPCEDYLVTALIEMEDLETKAKSEIKLLSTFWTTAESGSVAKLKQEEQAYAKQWSQATGMDKVDFSMLGTTMVASLSGAGEKELSQALHGMPQELKKIKGYPIVTRVEWFSKESGGTAAPASDESALSTDDAADLPNDVGGALGALAGKWASKKANQKVKEKTTPKPGAPIYSSTTEIQSIQTDTLPAAVFEVPSGFKKVS